MIKRSIKKALSGIARILTRYGAIPDFMVLNMDGGICSQMHFYIVGRIFEKKGQRVLYNLDWFSKEGKDMDGRFCQIGRAHV